ncbi:MAG: DUF2877 domain-containing protein [Anaerolineales bacterium]|nr:MAG: DUF2877 domain-containing protein [Anaerolineales bacterium]
MGTTGTLQAISISRPVQQRLEQQGFEGRVLSVHQVACNLIDEDRNVITLLAPSAGDGPFSIVIDSAFDDLSVDDPILADAARLVVGDMTVSLDGASIWEPRPDWPRLRMAGEHISRAFVAFDEWAPSAIWGGLAHITGADQYAEGKPTFMARLARGKEAYSHLIVEGLGEGKRDSLMAGARLLAGLGPGGTPAGDDFLVGVMAAMWLLGDQADAPAIAGTAAPRTSALSAAFLRAAGRGEFITPWHTLVEALASADLAQVEQAAMRMESFGASSGADALDGFILSGRRLMAQYATCQQAEEPI